MTEDPSKPKRIGEILIENKTIEPDQLERALVAQRQIGGALGEHLVRQGAVDDVHLLSALSAQTGLQYVQLPKIAVPPGVLKLVSLDTVRKRRLLPIHLDGQRLLVGFVDPRDLDAIRQAEVESGHAVRPVLLSGVQLDEALRFFDQHGYGTRPLTLTVLAPGPTALDLPDLLRAMIQLRGQDLYLTAGAIPAIKVDNELRRLPLAPVTGEEITRLLEGHLTPAQRATFDAQLELDFAHQIPHVGRFRCNVYRQRGAVAFTARHIVEKIPTFEDLGLPRWLHEFAHKQQGLVLITGPTGHGKSTTLASLVDVINHERQVNVITIEDPIEFVHQHRRSNVNQREVGTDTRSFAEGLRHVFRQAPDVMVVGELRDHESTSIALTAAETGHLVLATMHSLNATATVDRIVDLYPPAQQHQVRAQLAESLLLVFSQRLLRRRDGRGRALAYERVSTSLRVKNALREGKAYTLRGLMQSNHEELSSLDQALADLVVAGTVTREEAHQYAESPGYVDELCRVRG
ncbi:MAG: PilT/PilU family type 4a pilus ATPase [Verrucomicrobia bacterium]|nr:PilT/PilU family type 4a pilus ATPase [Verrucomicrobiota bacterium]